MARRASSGPGLPRGPLGPIALGSLLVVLVGAVLAGVMGGQSPTPASLGVGIGAGQSGQPSDSAPVASPANDGATTPVSGTTPPPDASQGPSAAPGTALPVATGPFAGYLMIADRQNGRILMVDTAGTIHWQFPAAPGLPRGQGFSADDAFLSPDGTTITANEEGHQVIVRIDIATRKIVWEYGSYDRAGSGPGQLHTPDDAYPLANGDIVVADIGNCRIIEVSKAKKIVRQWGRTGACAVNAPRTYGSPNGDTPLPDGGLLVTEIHGSRVVRLDRSGHVVFDIHVPTTYPSDAQLLPNGDVLVVDYANPGAVIRLDRHGKVVWRYRPSSGAGRLDHPSLAIALPNGLIAVNDDFRDRVVIIDPKTNRIVWQYGRTDHLGRGKEHLYTPDGITIVPPSVAATI
jgi:outer membrane protein assembly factor BamB